MGTSSSIGTVQAVFTADTRNFDVSTKGVGEQLTAAGSAAERAATKIASAGQKIDRTAQLQQQAVQRAQQAWQKELVIQDERIQKQQQVARAQELAALKQDIFTRSTQKATAAQSAFGSTLGKIQTALGGLSALGFTVGLGAIAMGLKSMVTETLEAGVQLSKLHEQTGISAQDLSVLKYAAQQSGVEFDTLARGFKKLAVTVYDADTGNKTAIKGFNQLGITLAQLRAKGDDMYSVLVMLAEKFQQMPDGIAKSDAAAKIFGTRMGSEMIPVLNQGTEALERFKAQAPIITDADLKQIDKLHQSLASASAEFHKIGTTLTVDAAPALSKFFDWLDWRLQKDLEEWNQRVASIKASIDWLSRVRFGVAGGVMPTFYLAPAAAAAAAPGALAKPSGSAPPESPDKESKGSGRTAIEADEEAFNELKLDHEVALQEEVDFWEKRLAAAKKGSDEYREVLARLAPLEQESMRKGIGAGVPVDWSNPMQAMVARLSVIPAGLKQQALAIQQMGAPPMGNIQLPMPTLPQMGVTFPQPQQSVVLGNQLEFALKQLRDSLKETAAQFTDLGAILSGTVKQTLDSFNETLMKILSTPANRMHGTHPWANLGASVAKDTGAAALKFGEGTLMKGVMGLFGKHAAAQLGTKSNPMYVQFAGGTSGAGTSSSLLGPGGISSLFTGGGGVGSGISSITEAVTGMAGFADGGVVNPGGFHLVGERGPELLQVGRTSRISSAEATKRLVGGGDTHVHIDATGSQDPAATAAAVHRAMSAYLPQLPTAARASMRDYNNRVPSGRRI